MEVDTYRGHPTIREDWERFYREFPDVYDRFALSSVHAARLVGGLFPLGGADVLVLAAGTGRDAFEVAHLARRVVATDPWIEMREYGLRRQAQLGIENVDWRDGTAEDLSSFAEDEFDCALSVHGAPFPWDVEATVRGCLRVVRPAGLVAFVTTTPGWHKAHDDPAIPADRAMLDAVGGQLERFGFTPSDVLVELEYGSVEEALATWGFIYGDRAIDHVLETRASTFPWSLRTWHRTA